tara:strand:+ start:15 stop:953 length:939 start_codon:yes stop_codon:yes gene_type:complete
MDKLFYNQASQEKLGWDPSWFGKKYNDEDLIVEIKKWQKSAGIKADGLIGPMTYRRIWTERESKISEYTPYVHKYSDENYIVHNSKFIPIEWDKVVLWSENGGLKMHSGTYTDLSGKEDRKPTMFVNHWDVCLSSESCFKVLNKRGISVHFLIDNDGTIYQILDTQHKAWHAGISNGAGGNPKGIGVEIANAYYTKYQNWYVKNGFGERPILENAYVHGKKQKPFLGFYPVQIEALKSLWKAISIGCDIPLEYPRDLNGDFETSVHNECVKGRFKGICNHYNFTKGKIDCAGLDVPKLIDEVKSTKEYCLDK